MLVIPVKEGEQIDRALKRLKRKFLQTGTLKKIREKKQYIKPTERHRVKMQKASYSLCSFERNGIKILRLIFIYYNLYF